MADLTPLSPEKIAQIVPNWPPNEVAKNIADFSLTQLEVVGKFLSHSQALSLLDYALQDPRFHWKLSPLLVGMPHTLFSHLLLSASPKQIEILKMEAITEPVQHHLTLLTHEVTHQLPHVLDQLDQISAEIVLVPVAMPNAKDPSQLKNQLKAQAEWHEATLQVITKVLMLAWNSNRIDLIDKLSHAKEGCQRAILHMIGKPKSPFGEATGLYARLEEGLAAIYGNPQDAENIEAADEDEPVLEGLAKFSIWYLKDYYDLGLLPHIASVEQLDLDPTKHSEQERLDNRERLMRDVSKKLQEIGLTSVKDLKNGGIYSLDDLREYIKTQLTPN